MDKEKKVDVVITWVNGSDTHLQKKRQSYLSQPVASDAVSATRFASNDEVYFCIASILKYMPWSGTIYLVTDQQQPKWIEAFANQDLCTEDKIQIIDHQQLFQGYEQFLPTFNSLSIETMLWNIPNLSNNFVYFNDDVFINSPLSITDYFVGDKVVIYGKWKSNATVKIKYLWRTWLSQHFGKIQQPKFNVAQLLSSELVGLKKYYALEHRPHFLQKNQLKSYFATYPKILEKQIGFKFRDITQFLPISLSNHLSIKYQFAILKPNEKIIYIKPNSQIDELQQELNDEKIKCGCIQSLDLIDTDIQNQIKQLMLNKFSQCLPKQLLETKYEERYNEN